MARNRNSNNNNNLIEDLESNIEATTDILGFCPPNCPECGTQMQFSFSAEVFQCPSCSFTVGKDIGEDMVYSDDDYDDIYDEPDEELPDVCKNCGGPYPSCTSGCKLIDED